MQKEQTEERQKNVLIIADGDIAIYYKVLNQLSQINDQIEILCLDRYLQKTLTFIDSLGAWGIFTLDYLEGKQLQIQKIEKDLENEGGKYKKFVNRIIISKHPVLYRFTKK
jgi:hypothetical protein